MTQLVIIILSLYGRIRGENFPIFEKNYLASSVEIILEKRRSVIIEHLFSVPEKSVKISFGTRFQSISKLDEKFLRHKLVSEFVANFSLDIKNWKMAKCNYGSTRLIIQFFFKFIHREYYWDHPARLLCLECDLDICQASVKFISATEKNSSFVGC